jgi:hypothetical protein
LDINRLALASRDVLGDYLQAPPRAAFVIKGDAYIGKTSAAYLLQFLGQLCENPAPEVTHASRPPACARALRAFVDVHLREAHPNRILILENPFGSTESYDPNHPFVSALRKFAKQSAGTHRSTPRIRLIITSRASCWQRALREHGEILEDLTGCSCRAADWYTTGELSAFLEALIQRRTGQTRREIATGELATPIAIEEAVSTRPSHRREEVVNEKRAFLEALEEEPAWFAVLARLQEFCFNGATETPLQDEVPDPTACFEIVQHMLRESTLDELSYVTPAHSTDREAIDAYFIDHRERLEPQIQDISKTRGPLGPACDIWATVLATRAGDVEAVEDLQPEQRRDWLATLIEEAARCGKEPGTIALLDRVSAEEHDFWSYRELVFEIVRLWPQIRASGQAQSFLRDLLAGEDTFGRYLVLEAMLYLQAATYPDAWDLSGHAEVWDKLSASRWELFADPEARAFELALIRDALVWCPPRLVGDEMVRWLQPLAESAERHPPLLASFLFSSLYHPHGTCIFEEAGVSDPAAGFGEQALSPEQAQHAAELIQWHFVHQSRARALLYRRDLEPAHAYLLHRETPPTGRTLSVEEQKRCRHLIERLAAHIEYAGWALHLAMNIHATRGEMNPAVLADLSPARLAEGDLGVVTAVLTYKIPQPLQHLLVDYFKEDVNRTALLDAMRDGPVVWGTRVTAPRFNALRAPRDIHAALELEWKELEADDLPLDDEQAFLEDLRVCARSLTATMEPDRRQDESRDVWEVVRRAKLGDYRPLEHVKLRELGKRVPAAPRDRLSLRLEEAARRLRISQ